MEIEYILAADNIFADKENKVSAIGIFQKIFLPKDFPSAFARFSIIARVLNISKTEVPETEIKAILSIKDPDRIVISKVEMVGGRPVDEKLQLIGVFPGINLSKEGKYTFHITINDKEIKAKDYHCINVIKK